MVYHLSDCSVLQIQVIHGLLCVPEISDVYRHFPNWPELARDGAVPITGHIHIRHGVTVLDLTQK